MFRSLILIFSFSLCNALCLAQSRQIPAARQSAPIAITNATVHTLVGDPIERGHVIIVDGKIVLVGSGSAPIADDFTFIDGTGLHVYPGLFSIGSTLGLIETSATDVTHDHDELGTFTPEVRAIVAVNPDSDHIPVAREVGVLSAVIFPTGDRIPGRASAIRLDGWTNEDLSILDDAGLVINWPRYVRQPSRGGPFDNAGSKEDTSIEELDDLMQRARDWASSFHAGEVDHNLTYAALQPVLEGSKPVYLVANTKQQIMTGVAWSNRNGLKAIIVGGSEAPQCAELLIQEEVPVVCNTIMSLPHRRDLPFDHQYTLPSRLRDAGITFCIASGEGSSNVRRLPFNAGKAVAYGLTQEQAIAAISRDAAAICGLGDSLGTIEPGKAGTVILTDGSPLDIRTRVHHAWIDGRKISLQNRHSELNDKYIEKYKQLNQER